MLTFAGSSANTAPRPGYGRYRRSCRICVSLRWRSDPGAGGRSRFPTCRACTRRLAGDRRCLPQFVRPVYRLESVSDQFE